MDRAALEAFDLHWYNASMRKFWTVVVTLFVSIGILLSACDRGTPVGTVEPTGTLEGTLRPYPSDTPSATPLPTDYISPTPSPTITPTPTPVYYEIQLGDDMYSIAFRYGLSPQALMTANPDIDPRAMIVGISLLIPVTPMAETTPSATVELSPTATPRFANMQTPDCYPDALGGLWCFVLIENDETGALENVSGVVILGEGENARQETAIMPLNLLPPGESLPLIAYFQPPIPANYTISAQVDFLLPVMPDDQRYLDVEILDQSVTLSEDGEIAEVTGTLSLPEDQPDAQYVWVSATAIDHEGHVVAVRRWDNDDQLTAGSKISFELTLYSMAGAIDRVDLVVEAQTIPDAAEGE
jgi:LysM repeat protein